MRSVLLVYILKDMPSLSDNGDPVQLRTKGIDTEWVEHYPLVLVQVINGTIH
jgi:hypothetical protein